MIHNSVLFLGFCLKGNPFLLISFRAKKKELRHTCRYVIKEHSCASVHQDYIPGYYKGEVFQLEKGKKLARIEIFSWNVRTTTSFLCLKKAPFHSEFFLFFLPKILVKQLAEKLSKKSSANYFDFDRRKHLIFLLTGLRGLFCQTYKQGFMRTFVHMHICTYVCRWLNAEKNFGFENFLLHNACSVCLIENLRHHYTANPRIR